MPAKCVTCGSRETEAQFQYFACLVCGAISNYKGEVVDDPVDPHVRAASPEVIAPETVIP